MFVETLFGFGGRIGRGGYWIITGVSIPAYVVAILLFPMGSVGLGLGGALFLLTLVIGFATQTKRFHDRDKSGWWCLISLVPFGSVWMLIELGFLPGSPGANRFGRPDSGDPRFEHAGEPELYPGL